jgi:hypothetical protein
MGAVGDRAGSTPSCLLSLMAASPDKSGGFRMVDVWAGYENADGIGVG